MPLSVLLLASSSEPSPTPSFYFLPSYFIFLFCMCVCVCVSASCVRFLCPLPVSVYDCVELVTVQEEASEKQTLTVQKHEGSVMSHQKTKQKAKKKNCFALLFVAHFHPHFPFTHRSSSH